MPHSVDVKSTPYPYQWSPLHSQIFHTMDLHTPTVAATNTKFGMVTQTQHNHGKNFKV